MNNNHPPGFTSPPAQTKSRFEAWRRLDGRQRGAIIAATPVAAVAAVASFGHIKELATHTGQPEYVAWGMPISVDGLIIVGSIAMTSKGKPGKRLFGWVVFTVGVLVSLAANLAVAGPSLMDKAVSAWPAISLLLAVEVLLRAVLDNDQDDLARAASEELSKLAAANGTVAVAEVLRSIAADMPELAAAFNTLAVNDTSTASPAATSELAAGLAAANVMTTEHGQEEPEKLAAANVAPQVEAATPEPPHRTLRPKPSRKPRVKSPVGKAEDEKDNIDPGVLEKAVEFVSENASWLLKLPKATQDKQLGRALSLSERTARRYRCAATDQLWPRPDSASGQTETAANSTTDEGLFAASGIGDGQAVTDVTELAAANS